MESSTKSAECAGDFPADVRLENIPLLSDLEKTIGIPDEVLEATARACKALVRKREIQRALDLLRIVLAYTTCDWSMRFIGAWCAVLGIGCLSDVAIYARLRNCKEWLGKLVGLLLAARQVKLNEKSGVRLRLQDATVISKPGSTGTDYRIHISMDLGSLSMDGIEVTDAHTGETLAHYPTRPGDIRIGDRGYAFASSMGPVLSSGGWLVVRINWQNLPLINLEGKRFSFKDWLQGITQLSECQAILNTPQGTFCVRVIASPLPPDKAEEARRRARKAAQKKGHTPSPETLLAAGFVLLVTNLPQLRFDTRAVADFYRLRWQIELFFKRLKSLLQLDGLRSENPELGQTYLLGKVLTALIIDQSIQKVNVQQPEWFTCAERPASVWRLTAVFIDCFRNLVRGDFTWEHILEKLPDLQRYFRSSPRKRGDQLASARALLAKLSCC